MDLKNLTSWLVVFGEKPRPEKDESSSIGMMKATQYFPGKMRKMVQPNHQPVYIFQPEMWLEYFGMGFE